MSDLTAVFGTRWILYRQELAVILQWSGEEEKSGKIATADMPDASISPSTRGFWCNRGAPP